MTNDLVFHLVLTNLAGSVAILAVLALRGVVRARFGAGLTYALWLIAPAAMLTSLLPARTIMIAAPVAASSVIAAPNSIIAMSDLPYVAAPHAALDMSQILVGAWLTGVIVSLILLAVGQRRAFAQFGRITIDPKDKGVARASNRGVGPALVGVFRPQIIVPHDFETRFDAVERAMILAHEHTHLTSGHAAINGLTALIKAVNWFNPLVHVGAHHARIDQEMACDAVVLERFPSERRTYAQALLKTQLAFMPLPLGCNWPGQSVSLLERRIEMFERRKPGRARLLGGGSIVAVLTVSAGLAAWSAQPPVTTALPAPSATTQPPLAAPLASATAPAATEAPTTIGFACLSNNCGPQTQARVRNAAAVDAAIKAGDARAVMAAGGSARDVLAAWIAADERSINPLRSPDGRTLAERGIRMDSAHFVTNPAGTRLMVEFDLEAGGTTATFRDDIQGLAPPGTPTTTDLTMQRNGYPAGSTPVIGPDGFSVVGYKGPDGAALPPPILGLPPGIPSGSIPIRGSDGLPVSFRTPDGSILPAPVAPDARQ